MTRRGLLIGLGVLALIAATWLAARSLLPPAAPAPARAASESAPLHIDPEESGAVIAGRVFDADGVPVSDASVWIGEHWSEEPRETRTDREGAFRFRRLSPGTYHLSVFRAGYDWNEANAQRPFVVQAGTEGLVLHLVRSAAGPLGASEARLSGRVVRALDGTAVRRFRLSLTGEDGLVHADIEEAHPHGAFQVRKILPAGRLRIRAVADDDLYAAGPPEVVLAGGQESRVVLELEAGGAVDGAVLTPDGRPTEGAIVGIAPLNGGLPPLTRLAESGEGRFRLGSLAPGRYRLRAFHRGWLPAEQDVEVSPGRATPVSIRLRIGGSIRIRVTDVPGRPVPEAFIRLLADGRDVGSMLGPYWREHEERVAQGDTESWWDFFGRIYRTDERGETTIRYVGAGAVEVVVGSRDVGWGRATVAVEEARQSEVRIVLR